MVAPDRPCHRASCAAAGRSWGCGPRLRTGLVFRHKPWSPSMSPWSLTKTTKRVVVELRVPQVPEDPTDLVVDVVDRAEVAGAGAVGVVGTRRAGPRIGVGRLAGRPAAASGPVAGDRLGQARAQVAVEVDLGRVIGRVRPREGELQEERPLGVTPLEEGDRPRLPSSSWRACIRVRAKAWPPTSSGRSRGRRARTDPHSVANQAR